MGYACLLNLSGPAAFLNCLNTLEPAAWAAIFIGATILISGGWMIGLGMKAGMAVGGFSTTLIALMLFLLQVLSFEILLIPLMVMLIGVFLLVLDLNKT